MMFDTSLARIAHRTRRLWLTETLLVAAIMAFGGFAQLSDSKVSPSELIASVSDVIGH